MTQEYIKLLEETNQKLTEKLADFDLIMDILKSRVKVLRSDLFCQLDPYQVCDYLEKHGWKMNYECQHERYLTRSYQSVKGDCKVKIHLKDLHKDNYQQYPGTPVGIGDPRSYSDITKRVRVALEKFCHLHDKGLLEAVFEILRTTI